MDLRPITTDNIERAVGPWHADDELLIGKLRWLLHTPYAHGLLVDRYEDDVLAVGGCTHYGITGWITLLQSIDPEAHRILAEGLLAHLVAQGNSTQSTLSPLADVALWETLGFVQTETILRYSGGKFIQATHDEVIHYEAWHRMALLRLAKSAMGEDRSTLLMEHTYLGQVYAEGSGIRGFSLLLLGQGLIIADDPKVGLELQRWHFPLQEHVLIPAGNEAAHKHLTEQGYTTTVEGIRMVRGPVPELKVEMVFGWG